MVELIDLNDSTRRDRGGDVHRISNAMRELGYRYNRGNGLTVQLGFTVRCKEVSVTCPQMCVSAFERKLHA